MLDRPGVWKRSGLQGRISGLDVAEALASLPSHCDPDRARELLIAAETRFLLAFHKQNSSEESAPDG